jgi:hypothetical protein
VSGRYTRRTSCTGERGRTGAPLSWKEGPVTRQKGGARAFGQEVGPGGRSSLSARFAWPTSCPLRWSRYSLMLLVKRVGKRSERVTAVFIGAEPTPRPLAPQGRLCFAQKGGRQFLPDLPLAARRKARALRAGRTALRADGYKHSACASLLRQSVGCPVLPPLAHSRPRLSQIAIAQYCGAGCAGSERALMRAHAA